MGSPSAAIFPVTSAVGDVTRTMWYNSPAPHTQALASIVKAPNATHFKFAHFIADTS
jgi:hypothetical protein